MFNGGGDGDVSVALDLSDADVFSDSESELDSAAPSGAGERTIVGIAFVGDAVPVGVDADRPREESKWR